MKKKPTIGLWKTKIVNKVAAKGFKFKKAK